MGAAALDSPAALALCDRSADGLSFALRAALDDPLQQPAAAVRPTPRARTAHLRTRDTVFAEKGS